MSEIALALAPTSPARPGPGPVPETALRALDLMVRRRIENVLAGEHRAASLGIAMELAQIRPYQPGDDVRLIDWNATARMSEPHVRLHVAERALTTWLLFDGSPSMGFGTALRRKADVAEGVVLAVGHVASRRGNRLGLLSYGHDDPLVVPPRQGRLGLVGVLLQLREITGRDLTPPRAPDDLGEALSRARRHARDRSLIVVVSDLRGPREWTRGLREICVRHDVVVCEIRDPAEEQIPDVGEVVLLDPETGRHLRVDTGRRRLRERYAAAAAEERELVARDVRSAGAHHLVLSTGDDWLRPLVMGLANRPGRRGDDVRVATRAARARAPAARARPAPARAPEPGPLRRALQQPRGARRRRARDPLALALPAPGTPVAALAA